MKTIMTKISSIFGRTLVLLVILLLGVSESSAQLKIYYIRHAEGGHNIRAGWQESEIPESLWPSYVGDHNQFTPRGKAEVIATIDRLQKYSFDFIATSNAWRARNTILPYLDATGQSAEIWPELREGPGMLTILSKDIPDLDIPILNLGDPIELPRVEKDFFVLREDSPNDYKKYPRDADENLKVAYMKHVSLHAIDMIEKRFGGTDKSILLAGHNSSGVSLLKLLLKEEPEDKHGILSTGIWMVEQQKDGSYELKIYNNKPVGE